jgi:hypothetical protein
MRKLFFTCGVITAITCISCDPLRRIDLKNETGDSAYVIWTMEEDSINFNPFHLSNSKELKFTLYPPKNNEIKMSFGAGNWTPTEVGKLVQRLVSLEIISSSQHIKIDSLPLLKEFLLARRKGVGGATIEIVISN